MKAIEIRELTLDELEVRENELAEELARLRIQLAIKRLDNPLQVRVAKRELARVKTIIKEKSLAPLATESPRPAKRVKAAAGESLLFGEESTWRRENPGRRWSDGSLTMR